MLDQHVERTKQVLDAFSITATVATFVGWLPHIAAGLTVVWWLVRIYETDTVQKWLHRKRPAGSPPAIGRTLGVANRIAAKNRSFGRSEP